MDERTNSGADQNENVEQGFTADSLFDGRLFDELGRPRSIHRPRPHPSRGDLGDRTSYDLARDRIRELSAEHRALAQSSMSEGTEADFARRRELAAQRSRRRRDSAVGDQREHHSRMRSQLSLVH